MRFSSSSAWSAKRCAGGVTLGRAAPQKSIEINFSAEGNQLFQAWNSIANLADLAGRVTVTMHADSAEGFDKGKLQNGVLEPLRESGLIKQWTEDLIGQPFNSTSPAKLAQHPTFEVGIQGLGP